MGFPGAAVAGAVVTSVAAGKQASATGKYNQAVQNRNATIAEQEAGMLEQQLEFDLAQFDQQFSQLQGETKTNVLFSGAELSGSGLRILNSNMQQAEIQKNITTYNSQVAQSQKMEEANFARIQGQMARQSAKMAQLQTVAKTGTSLMSMGGSGGGSGSSPGFGDSMQRPINGQYFD